MFFSNPQESKVMIQVNSRPNGAAITTHITTTKSAPSTSSQPMKQQQSSEDFPALVQSSPVTQPQWVQQRPKKQQEQKNAKVAPAPVLPPSDLAQFPSLSKNAVKAKKTSSVTVHLKIPFFSLSTNWLL